jgi:hypothetical protein
MKISRADHEGLTAYLIFYGQWCLSMGFVCGVVAILMGGLPALFSQKFVEIWVVMDLVLPGGLLMFGAIGAVALAICWLVSLCFGKTGREWFKTFVRG